MDYDEEIEDGASVARLEEEPNLETHDSSDGNYRVPARDEEVDDNTACNGYSWFPT